MSPILMRPGRPSAVSTSFGSYMFVSNAWTSTFLSVLRVDSGVKNLFYSPMNYLTPEAADLQRLSSFGWFAECLL
jgi:hypothetical protein